MYLWSALIAGAALVVAYVDGRFLVGAILISAIVVATVLPRLIRDRTPRGSDRPPPVVRSSRRAGRHRRGTGSNDGGPSETPVGAADEPGTPPAVDGVPLRSESTPALSDTKASSKTRDTA
jgi:hypothetical protein